MLGGRNTFASQGTYKVCEDSKVEKRSPLPKGKQNKLTFSRRPMVFKEIPPAFPLGSALPLTRAGVEAAVQEHELDSTQGTT